MAPSLKLAILLLAGVVVTIAEVVRRDQTIPLGQQIAAMAKDPAGVLHVGDDGVLRSLAADKTVLGFIQLMPPELEYFASLSPKPETKRHLESTWAGIDGRAVEDLDSLVNPRGVAVTPWTASGEIDSRATCCGSICDRSLEAVPKPADTPYNKRAIDESASGALFRRNCPRDPCTSTSQCGSDFDCNCVLVDCSTNAFCVNTEPD